MDKEIIELIAKCVLESNRKIADVARQFGISPSTVRRCMDIYCYGGK
jgi:transposase-like protein